MKLIKEMKMIKTCARLVAQDHVKGKLEMIFAAMPPCEAERMFLSLPVTQGILYAPAKRNVEINFQKKISKKGCAEKSLSLWTASARQFLIGKKSMLDLS